MGKSRYSRSTSGSTPTTSTIETRGPSTSRCFSRTSSTGTSRSRISRRPELSRYVRDDAVSTVSLRVVESAVGGGEELGEVARPPTVAERRQAQRNRHGNGLVLVAAKGQQVERVANHDGHR